MNAKTLKGRIATLALGHTMDQVMTKGFDFVLYPAAMLYLGAMWGSIAMICLSFLICLATMKFYDWSKTDWLGLEFLKELREEQSKGLFSQVLAWALRKGNWAVMIVLSIYKDPFITTVYMRKGANRYDGMGKREWSVFLTSLVISNLWWSVIVNLGIAGFKLSLSHV